MPELPEVETIVRLIRPRLTGRTIAGLFSNTPRLFRGHTMKAVKNAVVGRKLNAVDRIGKNIIFRLDGTCDLWLHLMMSGGLIASETAIKNPYIRAEFVFDNGSFLYFKDIRKFGRIRLVAKDAEITGVGTDALCISLSDFNACFQRHASVKARLLAQDGCSGIGNIYADEILWYAGIHPARQAHSLSQTELRAMYRAMQNVLAAAIQAQGTSFRNYRKPDGSEGGYFAHRKVYQRAGEPCLRDGAAIQKITLGQRGTHFCPAHQK